MNVCQYGYTKVIIKHLINHGAEVTEESKYNDTPLIIVCIHGNESIIKIFGRKKGAIINKENSEGKTHTIN